LSIPKQRQEVDQKIRKRHKCITPDRFTLAQNGLQKITRATSAVFPSTDSSQPHMRTTVLTFLPVVDFHEIGL